MRLKIAVLDVLLFFYESAKIVHKKLNYYF